MEFKFSLEGSKVLDYLKFPRLLYYNDDISEADAQLFQSITKPSYQKFVDASIVALRPYEAQIQKYYHKDMYSNYDYISVLIHAFPVFEYKTVKDYFKHLVGIDISVFRSAMIKAILTIDNQPSKEDQAIDEVNAMRFINDLKIDPANKWNMLMMIQDPKSFLNDFMDLLESLKSYFENYYEENILAVKQIGQELVSKLSSNPNEAFKTMTYHAITYDFTEYDECHIYVSAVFPYALSFADRADCRIIWGMEMSEAFEKMHAINEDKTTQRVKIFKALGDKTRYEVLKLLAKGITSTKEIAEALDVSSATISYHINEFLTSGIIYFNKEKNQKSGYKVDYDKLETVIVELKNDLWFS